jgi:2'-5' RNA ligase
MSLPRRVFYVVYSSDEYRQHILDAIRYLADPNEKSRAHVTLRGPYTQQHGMIAAKRAVDGSEIIVTGVDAFLRPRQNTVFFDVSAPGLAGIWHKPSYPEFRPHLTIYDGQSRHFAKSLWSKLKALNPTFSFRASALEPLITTKGQGSLELRSAFDEALVSQLTGRHVTVDEVPQLSEDDRIDLIAKLCSRLTDEATSEHDRAGSPSSDSGF